MLVPLIICSTIWGICNRLWGWGQGQRFMGIALLGGAAGMFAASLGLNDRQIAGIVASATIGYFLGRLHDGVRGTHWQKALRGLLYSGIPIGFALATWSAMPLLAILWAPLNGLIAWACSKLPVTDSTMYSELLTGFTLGLTNLGALLLTSSFIC